jgi:hypothetical protein
MTLVVPLRQQNHLGFSPVWVPHPCAKNLRMGGVSFSMILLSIMANSSTDNWGCGCLFLLAILAWGGFALYQWSDSAGYVTHSRTVDVYMKGEWLVGENRVCTVIPDYENPGAAAVVHALNCSPEDMSPTIHNLNIKFWGRLTRPDIRNEAVVTSGRFTWRCTRDNDGFTCYAIN